MADVVQEITAHQVCRITLQRPEIHNAFNDVVIQEVTRAFEQAGDRPDVRVVILSAAGTSFCAGADVKWMRRMVDYSMDENVADARRMSSMLRTIRECPKPVIARVQGATIGGGVGLVAACDIVIAVKQAVFSLSEVRLGIVPAVISPFVLEKIGCAAARRFALTAERFDAGEARRIGLVSEVVDAEADLDPAIERICAALMKNGPRALSACKRILTEVHAVDWERVQALTSQRIAELRVSEEGQEGLKAFLEKRKPGW